MLFQQEDILPHATKLLKHQVETEIILAAVGDLSRGVQSHTFKSTTFKLVANCELCGERIWALSKGLVCTDCGYACHTKCEMKVPAACPGVLDKAGKKALREEKKAMNKTAMASETDLGGGNGLTRTNTTASVASSSLAVGRVNVGRSPSISDASISSVSSATTSTPSAVSKSPSPPSIAELPADAVKSPARRILAPPPSQYVKSPAPVPSDDDDTPPATPIARPTSSAADAGKMIYAFTASGENEVSAAEGAMVEIVDDDGAWMTVRVGGREGLVPSSYVVKVEKKKARGPPPPVRPRGSSKRENPAAKKVRALYAYAPQGDDEVAMEAGEELVVLERDVGGWVRVRRGGQEGLVPGTYVADC